MQGQHYCEHFKNSKFTKTIEISEQPACKYCLIGKNYLWLCLAKNCGVLLCDRNDKQHIKMHLQQSKTKKLFHSIFINVLTAQIICIHCDIQIYDIEQVKSNKNVESLPDPYLFRVKILPALSQLQLQKNKIMGQLENSQGHKKISKALTGFFSDKKNHAINSGLQFLMQFQLFRDIILNIKPLSKQLIIKVDKQKSLQLFSNKLKRLSSELFTLIKELIKILINETPSILGYRRKDPFEHVLYFMTKIHELIKYYTVDLQNSEYDQWDLLGTPSALSKLTLNCPLFDNTTITLALNYSCKKCDRQQSLPANINFLKLSFPKKKRKVKQVEKQLAEYRFSSPVKHRRKSLINLFKKQEQCPFTIPELLIQFTKYPYHKDKNCIMCKEPLHKNKINFQSLPEYLIIQINRMGVDGNSVDQTRVQFTSDPIDLGPFIGNKSDSVIYNFQTAICIQNVCSYPVIARSRFNKQVYIFKNQLVSMLKFDKTLPNPYIICYKKQCPTRDYTKLKDCFNNIKSNILIEAQNLSKQHISIPDFWLCQLKNYITKPLNNQLVCKHNRLKPNVKSKMKYEQKVPFQVYDYILEMFKGKQFKNIQCIECFDDMKKITQRKRLEKQKLIEYEKMKTSCFCMVSNPWIKKWMSFLYGKGTNGYFSKGNPLPGPIDNKLLLEDQKCKANLRKNQDYKVVNIFIWRFLKEIYGGGPQIRYKWNKNEISESQQQLIKEVKQAARQIKQTYMLHYVESPKKNSSTIIEKSTSFVDSVRGSQEASQLSIPQQIS